MPKTLTFCQCLSTMMEALLILLLVAGANACGNPTYLPYTRVVNGINARPYSWPWQVSLEVNRGTYYSHTCGGSLIDSNWVLTAGHCISSGRSYRVVLGEYDRRVDEGSEEVIDAAKIFVHPQWNPSCLACGNDIALIKLTKPATLSDKVKPACIPPAGEIFENGFPCIVTGWGRLYTGGPTAAELQQALLPIVDHQTCKQIDWWGNSVRTTMVCAGGYEKSGCNGDSGGPLNCQGAEGLWYVFGVVSFGSSRGCNTPQKPTVFTRVSAFNSWIASTMASN
ncbi:proproteinase E-like [Leucoraja erinacea]|uniref:proproteinase E-like n=1 Tax=Leucoraja erinaceus TaxID=7782 RepID=UPI0024580789|nr:proproteinase E-like [Leucoraja erinacea]